MRKIFILLFGMIMLCPAVWGAIVVRSQAPEAVAVNEQFRVQYTVNSQSVTDISAFPDMSGFEVLYGPSKSTSFSMQIINGKQSQSSSTTYTYVLLAKKKGDFVLPRLTVTVGGRNYTSNAVKVRVLQNANTASSSSPALVKSSGNAKVSNKDLFIAVTANKNEVYEQEPVLLTYRVYSKVNLRELRGNMPDLKGFMVKEIPLPQQKSFSVGTFHGENYYTTVWSQYLMFPQQSGKLQIPQIKFDGVVVISNPDIDLLDAFFNGTSGAIQKRKTIIAPSLDIKVKPLPEKPADFSGGVGDFTIKAVAKNPTLKENETLNFQVAISGVGNVDLIKAPQVKFPNDFDVYDPKMTNNTKLSTTSMNGSLVIDYPAVPKNKGEYTIPPVSLTYFDTKTHSYKTITTQPIKVTVLKGEKNVFADKQREILAKSDIRYIKTGEVTLYQKEDGLWNTAVYWLLYGLGIVVFGAIYYGIYRQKSMQGNTARKRSSGASHLAIRRLKKAKRLCDKGESDAFFEEMLNALNGFAADKMNIPIAELSKERMSSELKDRDITPELQDRFFQILDECEFMRYAGGSEKATRMEEKYQQGLQIISLLDSQIRKKK